MRKERLRIEMIETQQRFHGLVARIPESAYAQPSDNPAWNIGQVLYHMSLAPRFMVMDVAMIMRAPRFFQRLIAGFPRSIFDWFNMVNTRRGARNPTPDFLIQEYDQAHDRVLALFDSLSESQLDRSMLYPGWDPVLNGEVTLAELFGYVKLHFDAHAGPLEALVAQKN
jgi:hypothetical protein